eukprot:PRCOL_00006738-RA
MDKAAGWQARGGGAARQRAATAAAAAAARDEARAQGGVALKVLSSPLFYVTAGFAFASRLVDAAGDAFAGAAVVALAAAPIAGRPDAFGPGRRTLLPNPPSHLRGELAGDYGLDPLGLAREGGPCEALVRFAPFDPRGEEARKGVLQRLCELELLHARWAMLAVPGAALPEALQRALGVDLGGEGAVWWRVGAAKAAGASLNYFGIEGFRVAGGTGILTIALVLMGGPEYARYCGIEALEPVGVFLPGDPNYPGGAVFDPFGFADDADAFVENQLSEIAWGRAAMVAFVGIAAQAAATRKGPVENLLDFAADPAHNNALALLAE